MIKSLWKALSELYRAREDINSAENYKNAQKWNKRVLRIFIFRTIIALIIAIALIVLVSSSASGNTFLFALLIFVLTIATAWGFASMKVYRKEVVKGVFKAASAAYKVGQKFETTHYTVSHEYANTYKVSSYKTNDGCLFAIISVFVNYTVWSFFCVYFAPFIIFKKFTANLKEIKSFKENAT